MKAKTITKLGIAALVAGTAIAYRRQILYRLNIAKTVGGIFAAHVQSRLTGQPVNVLLAAKLGVDLEEPWIQGLQTTRFGDEFALSST